MFISGPQVETLWRVAQARSADKKGLHPNQTQVQIIPQGDGCNIAATDGYVLAVAHLSPGEHDQVTGAVHCLIPDAVLKLIKPAHFTRYNAAVALEMTEAEGLQTWSYFGNGSKTTITLPPSNMGFPRWEKCIPRAEVLESLDALPNAGYSLEVASKVNAVLGFKDDPFQSSLLLMSPKSTVAVGQRDGVTVITQPLILPEGQAEGHRLAILKNIKFLGLAQ